ncbi:alcohol dehydrogenase catalytic domain-containing protein (plasmid) [Prescottella equi]|uniref:zinc-binding dehydrogenase n=1 Tax=Rhodococcus hoagii TaxID=43767 RepID=UPI002577462F|nr:alcohol dehydrogenase catalytic domain-containing protein [Prescottella equi]WJJ14456.1 alcohol dehydrogenase catalytic domain-containing protein [Prescottella equi]
MKAAVLTESTPSLEIQDIADPEPGAGQVVLQVEAAGICGSDLHLAPLLKSYPGVVFGHEFSGRVVARGKGVDSQLDGQLAVGFPLVGCHECQACRSANPARCVKAELTGVQRQGAFAEFVAIDTRDLFVLPGEVGALSGALVEPLAVAHHALEKTPREPGAPLLILGAGPVGLAVALYARLFGASEVLVSDPVPARRKLAEAVGARTVDPATENVGEVFAELTGSAPTTVIECVGIPGLIQHATDAAAPDAHITIVGACTAPDTFTPTTAMSKELTFQFVLYYRPRDFEMTIAHLAAGRLDPAALITDVIGLEALPARFEALMQPTTECKVLVAPKQT